MLKEKLRQTSLLQGVTETSTRKQLPRASRLSGQSGFGREGAVVEEWLPVVPACPILGWASRTASTSGWAGHTPSFPNPLGDLRNL